MGNPEEELRRPRRKEVRHCHCAGHRVIFVFGSDSNATIAAALAWTLARANVQHKVYYTRASGDNPQVPNAARNGWDGVRRPNGTTGKTKDLGQQIKDCCFFEEILVMAHGSHPGLKKFLSETLGHFIQTRPVRKLTVWACETAADIFPNDRSGRHYYEKICGLIQPRACPCNCDLALCDGRCVDPDGATRAGYKCPSVEEKSKLYLAAWEDRVVGGNTRYVAAKLGLVPNDPGGDVFTSPDGRLREVTISADGSTEIDVDTGFNVFAGVTVRADDGLKHPDPGRANSLNREWRETPAPAMPPRTLHGYTGPLATACANREGCLVDEE